MKATVLVVDDDEAIADLVRTALERAQFQVRVAGRADDALLILREGGVDLLLLDIQLPGLSGLELLALIKKDPATMGLPVILLTSRNEEKTRVEGLKAGADDYVTKPFSVAELSARVEALLRRTRHGGNPAPILVSGPFRLELECLEASADGKVLPLTETEFRLLSLLVQNPGRLVTVESLTQRLSPDGREVNPDTVYAHVRNLRKKLGPHHEAVQSVHGLGYKLATQPASRR